MVPWEVLGVHGQLSTKILVLGGVFYYLADFFGFIYFEARYLSTIHFLEGFYWTLDRQSP